MARLVLLLVTAFQVGCELPPLPKDIYIESRFSDMETSELEAMIDQINDDLIRPCLGYDGLIRRGMIVDEDGFSYASFDDDVHVIYKLDVDTDTYRQMAEWNPSGHFGGYATLQDVIMVRNLGAISFIDDQIAGWESLPDLGEEGKESLNNLYEQREKIITTFKHVALHELGHHVGLTHNPDLGSLMHADANDDLLEFQLSDKDAFAFIRDCEYPDP